MTKPPFTAQVQRGIIAMSTGIYDALKRGMPLFLFAFIWYVTGLPFLYGFALVIIGTLGALFKQWGNE